MTFTTTTQSLVGPTGGDLIVAAGDAVTDLAMRTDARLDAQDANLAVSQFPPLTVLESKVLANFERNYTPGWTFDTVLVDTQAGANLAQYADRIFLNRTGYWMLGGYADASTAPGSITSAFCLNININNPSNISFEQVQTTQFDGSNGLHGSCSNIARVNDATNAYCFMSALVPGLFNSGFPNTVPVSYRRMWAYWLGDL